MPTRLWVRSDRRLLRRVLQNLVSNAIKYTASGKVLLGVRRRGDRLQRPGARHRARHPQGQARADLQGVPAPGGDGAVGARPGPRAGHRRAHRQGAGPRHRACSRCRAAARRSRWSCRGPSRAPRRSRRSIAAPSAGGIGGLTRAVHRQRARRAAAACRRCSRAGAASSTTAQSAAEAIARAAARRRACPTSSWPTTISTSGTGLEAVAAAASGGADRRRPVIVITADHSAEVQREVRARGYRPAAQAAEGGRAARADVPAHLAARGGGGVVPLGRTRIATSVRRPAAHAGSRSRTRHNSSVIPLPSEIGSGPDWRLNRRLRLATAPPKLRCDRGREARASSGQEGQPLRVLGIVCDTHDSGIALLEDGVPAFVLEEERFNRQKHTLKFPFLSLAAAMEERNASHRRHRRHHDALGHAAAAAHLRKVDPRPTARQPQPAAAGRQRGAERRRHVPDARGSSTSCAGCTASPTLPPIVKVGHHDAHAAMFFASPFEEATVLVMDGYGDDVGDQRLYRQRQPAGAPLARRVLQLARHGLHLRHLSPGLRAVRGRHGDGARRLRRRHLRGPSSATSCTSRRRAVRDQHGLSPLRQLRPAPPLHAASSSRRSGRRARRDEPITDRHRDLAFALQAVTEESCCTSCARWPQRIPSRNLCLTGGVALNCVANARILRDTDYRARLGAAVRLRHRRAARQRAVALPSDARAARAPSR